VEKLGVAVRRLHVHACHEIDELGAVDADRHGDSFMKK
jgi:hypothetical protein